MLDNPKIRLSADKSPSTINDDVICSALGAYLCHQKSRRHSLGRGYLLEVLT